MNLICMCQNEYYSTPATLAGVDVKNHKDLTINKDTEIDLSLSTAELIDMERYYIFCSTIVKLINEWEMSSPHQYFINDKKLLHKAVREDDKSLNALIVPQALTKCFTSGA